MRDEVLEKLRELNLTAQDPTWADRWLDSCLNALLAGIALASIVGVTYVLMRY